MHDIDDTRLEFGSELTGYEAEPFELNEGASLVPNGGALSEADEYELAAELLGVESEEELNQFLGGLIKKVAQRFRRRVRTPIGQAIGGVLKGVAKKALPLAGTLVEGPLGAKISSGLAAAAGTEPGVEGEPPQDQEQEDQEFEGAKQFVRLAVDTMKKAVAAPASADPRTVAQAAAISAARLLAPALLNKGSHANGGNSAPGIDHSGRWVRRGNTIIVYGL